MQPELNIYCDESCHLQNDQQSVMVLALLTCPREETHRIAEDVRRLKAAAGLSPRFEIKWVKVSPAKLIFYQSIVDYFFETNALRFRAIIIPDKSVLRHEEFSQSHDEWYYKMFYRALAPVVQPRTHRCNIYLDYKDTRGNRKAAKLRQFLQAGLGADGNALIQRVQLLRSHEAEQIQIADLLAGSLAYANRNLSASSAKAALVRQVQVWSRESLIQTTRSPKFDLLRWEPRVRGIRNGED